MTSSGGYPCKFVEQPPSEVQTECPICLQVLRDPYLTTCCGSNFCHSCSQQLQTDQSLNRCRCCPTCRRTYFSFAVNNDLKRSLNQRHVFCTHSDGCEWIGRLGDLQHHLNEVINSGESFQHEIMDLSGIAFCFLFIPVGHIKEKRRGRPIGRQRWELEFSWCLSKCRSSENSQ